MDVMEFKVKLMKSMYDEVNAMRNEYIHKDLPIQEEHPFNIEHHIARYQVYRELLESIDKTIADRIDNECSSIIDVMHDYIDDFIAHIRTEDQI